LLIESLVGALAAQFRPPVASSRSSARWKCGPSKPGRLEGHSSTGPEGVLSKSADKPKKQLKKKPQKTLKERRSEKRAARKFGSGSLLRADE
jgi:hypothetical protein